MVRKTKKANPFSVTRLLGKALPLALHPPLLAALGSTLVVSLLAFAGFSILMLFVVGAGFLLFSSGAWAPLALFILVLGIAGWILGMIGINTFVSGVQFHLAMQTVARRPIDMNLAWKLSSARFRDAFVVQGSLLAFMAGIAVLSLIPAVLLLDTPTFLAAFADPALLISHAPLTVLMLAILYLFFQPFVTLALPIVYFESASPNEILARVRRYVQPHYIGILGAMIVLLFLSGILSTFADWITHIPLGQATVRGTALAFVTVSAFSFLVEILATLFLLSLNVCAQVLIYLHIGKPQAANHFTSSHPVARMLSNMAHAAPHHSPYLPVKWKQPGNPVRRSK